MIQTLPILLASKDFVQVCVSVTLDYLQNITCVLSFLNSGDIDLNLVHCTACNHQINTNSAASVKRHPVLKVILCKVNR